MPNASSAYRARRLTKAGEPDLRYGPRVSYSVRRPVPFSADDHLACEQHVSDLEEAGVTCAFVEHEGDKPEAWLVNVAAGGTMFVVYRAGQRIYMDTVARDSGARRDPVGAESADLCFQFIRVMCGLQCRCTTGGGVGRRARLAAARGRG